MMNKTRYLYMSVAAILVLIGIAGIGVLKPSTGAAISGRLYNGFGDLRLFEAQQNAPVAGALENQVAGIGFGELRRVEAEQSAAGMEILANTGAYLDFHVQRKLGSKNGSNNAGMGDLHYYDGERLAAGHANVPVKPAGIWDLHYYDGERLAAGHANAPVKPAGMRDLHYYDGERLAAGH
jgi:hypothetical protein